MNLDILKIASDTSNQKDLKKFTHIGRSKNSLCGDEIKIKLILKKNKIVDLGYLVKSCIYCQASASILSEYLKKKDLSQLQKTIEDINAIYDGKDKRLKNSLNKIFNKKNLKRKECIYLPIKSIKNALKLEY
tara:strand:+ start:655 stop:1050 length:396 start_codon:yes stop_codon:yes gene_type:complete